MDKALSGQDGASDHTGYGTYAAVIPPADFGLPQPEASSRAPETHFNIPAISEELAQEAFTEYVSSKCCYSSKPVKEMVFTDLQSLNTYRYRLETFTESRRTERDSEPYYGQQVDGSGIPPEPWSIPVCMPSFFQDSEITIPVPHTSSVQDCSSCSTLGRTMCLSCGRTGRILCGFCGGMGWTNYGQRQFCGVCGGTGRQSCLACGGMGTIRCVKCNSHGKLHCFISLKVTWKNNIHVSVIDKGSGFPLELLNQITGEQLFTDVAPMVYPVVSFPDSSVNAASESAVRKHQAQFSNICRILQQRQTIELIPITQVDYVWKGKTHTFYVYGKEHKVFTKDYPAKCCCCSIL
ncbi:ssu-2 homolog, tandem duplicate 3 [Danio rerio]|uniref:Ssu-2 homolog, tandem duplicate 3 n=1 Tax=Danio rerio TaxID=7955 RepID=A0AB13ABC4_DANRE|nr:ssu-2 homolog, tandem duplicate 3 [Danio rerio]